MFSYTTMMAVGLNQMNHKQRKRGIWVELTIKYNIDLESVSGIEISLIFISRLKKNKISSETPVLLIYGWSLEISL